MGWNTELWREAEKEGNKNKKTKKRKNKGAKLRNSAIFGKSIENPLDKVE